MRRIKLTIEYDGTDFAGWQRQSNAPTIQETLERTLEQMTGKRTPVWGAGRTDAGVHALGQVAHFDTEATIPVVGFRRGLNSLLPSAIAVIALEEAPPGFDARLSARGKLYRYRLWNADSRSPLRDRFVWHFAERLEVERMQQAALALEGRHDFAAFRAADCERKTTERHLYRLAISREGELVTVEAEGDAFLKNMVRIMVGTLVDVGRGHTDAAAVANMLASRDRQTAGPTAPAHGLCLVRVDY